MSGGGTYNNYWHADTAEEILSQKYFLEEMIEICKAYDKEEALQLLNDLYSKLNKLALAIEQEHEKLSKIMLDLERWQSDDALEEDFDETVKEFMSKRKNE